MVQVLLRLHGEMRSERLNLGRGRRLDSARPLEVGRESNSQGPLSFRE